MTCEMDSSLQTCQTHTDTQRTLVGDVRRSSPSRGRLPAACALPEPLALRHGSRPGDPTHGVGENVLTRRRQVGGGPTLERAKSTHYRHADQNVKRPEIQRGLGHLHAVLLRHRPQCRRVVLVGGGTLARSRSPRTFGAARRRAPQQISTQVTSEVNVAA